MYVVILHCLNLIAKQFYLHHRRLISIDKMLISHPQSMNGIRPVMLYISTISWRVTPFQSEEVFPKFFFYNIINCFRNFSMP